MLTGGRMPSAPDEIVLAPTTARDMHAATGSVVRLAGAAGPRALTVTGIGFVPSGPHNYYDDGAWLTPAGFDRLFGGAHYAFKFHVATVDPAAGRGRRGGGAPADRQGGGHQGRAGLHLHARASAGTGPGGQGRGRAAAGAERLPRRAGHRRRRARPVHRGPPSPPRTGRAARARPDPAAVPAGDRHPGHPARGHRAGLRHPAGHRARPDPVARRRRHDPAGLPPAGGAVGAGPDRAAGPGGRQPAGGLARPPRGAAAHRAASCAPSKRAGAARAARRSAHRVR